MNRQNGSHPCTVISRVISVRRNRVHVLIQASVEIESKLVVDGEMIRRPNCRPIVVDAEGYSIAVAKERADEEVEQQARRLVARHGRK